MLTDALFSVLDRGLRSFLAILGIGVGVAALVAMLSIGHMVENQTAALFAHLGVNLLEFQTGPNVTPEVTLNRQDIERLPSRLPSVANAVPLIVRHVNVRSKGQSADLTLVGVTPGFSQIINIPLQKGRLIRHLDGKSFVAVVGAEAARRLASSGTRLSTQELVAVAGYDFEVIGLLAPVPYTALDPADIDNSILVPIDLVSRVSLRSPPNAALVRMRPNSDGTALGAQISSILAKGQVGLQTLSARELVGGLQAQQATHRQLLVAIGGISLLVGGIGTMNVMLMSVMERRREIGLRAAVGASPWSIQRMFLAEAAIVGMVGSVLGLILGLIVAFIVSRLAGWAFGISLSGLVLGPGMGVVTALLFGVYPAYKASQLDPLDALRTNG